MYYLEFKQNYFLEFNTGSKEMGEIKWWNVMIR